MKALKPLIIAGAVAAALASAKTQGQSLTTTYDGIVVGKQVRGTWTDGPFYVEGAGVMNFQGFNAFCVEPTQSIEPGDVITYQAQGMTSLANYNSIARLVTAYLVSDQSAENAAAIQWAIWEVVSEGAIPLSLTDGRARIEGGASDLDVAQRANQYLANLNTYSPTSLTYLRNDTYQDVVSWNVIPEPSALGLGLVSGFLLLRRRRS